MKSDLISHIAPETLETRVLFTVITVTSAADTVAVDGRVTLREAMIASSTNLPSGDAPAGQAGVRDDIRFNIGGSGVKTINLNSPLPEVPVGEPVSIDGYTQPGTLQNTAAVGFNGKLLIELNGQNAGTSIDAAGLRLWANDCIVRGLIINRFAQDGIRIVTGSTGSGQGRAVITGNFIGTNSNGTAALGNGDCGIDVEDVYGGGGGYHTIGGSSPRMRNIISGNGDKGIAVSFSVGNNVIENNYVGTNAQGQSAVPNGDDGISFDAICVVRKNVVSGNLATGILAGEQTGSLIVGNYVGTNASGTAAIGNHESGIILSGSSQTTIGGTSSADRNIISGNGLDGIGVGLWNDLTLILGNYIGTDVTGMLPLGNAIHGVSLEGSQSVTIGGDTVGARNVISANGLDGIHLMAQTMECKVYGNYIGTRADGSAALGNQGHGVYIGSGSNYNRIGGTQGRGNIIAGSGGYGVLLVWEHAFTDSPRHNYVQGNYIGTTPGFATGFGNGGDGVVIDCAQENLIGGNTLAEGNVIAFNGGRGVKVFNHAGGPGNAMGNVIASNRIFSNARMAIDLNGDGITVNDPDDLDTGPHSLQNTPVLTSASVTLTTITVAGRLDTWRHDSPYAIQFFASSTVGWNGTAEARILIGTITVMTDATGMATFNSTFAYNIPAGYYITAAVTGLEGTSELAAPIVATI